ncbi:uncharacterized protein FIBRA_09066 [Fibroporia radiculosa]|uniref:Uncharacterized protein n=1 Tax=Fibroporia radiculosa TaxID=599839 RepID=J4GIT6_9APHY|nr:uncharacterized protein FIBRA_09066 [Fibroporia radiculosa]CCM06768.1 predicted protein [Fibroporia radiculosa]
MSQAVSDAILAQILGRLEALQVSQQALQAKLDALTHPVSPVSSPGHHVVPIPGALSDGSSPSNTPTAPGAVAHAQTPASVAGAAPDNIISDKEREKLLYPSRIMLTSKSSSSVLKGQHICCGAVAFRGQDVRDRVC